MVVVVVVVAVIIIVVVVVVVVVAVAVASDRSYAVAAAINPPELVLPLLIDSTDGSDEELADQFHLS